jgi:maltoporin
MLLNRHGATFVRLDSRTTPDLLKTNNPFYDKTTKKMSIVKDSSTNAMIGVNYANLVNNARNREALNEVKEALMSALGLSAKDAKAYLDSLLTEAGDAVDTNPKAFEPKERKWGKHMQLIDNDGELVFKQDKKGIYMLDDKGRIIPVLSKTMVDHTKTKTGEYNRYMQIMAIKSSTPVYRYADTLKEVSEEDLVTIKSFIGKKSSNADHQGLKKEIIIRDYKVQNIRTLRLNKTEYVLRDDAEIGEIVDTKTPKTASV